MIDRGFGRGLLLSGPADARFFLGLTGELGDFLDLSIMISSEKTLQKPSPLSMLRSGKSKRETGKKKDIVVNARN